MIHVGLLLCSSHSLEQCPCESTSLILHFSWKCLETFSFSPVCASEFSFALPMVSIHCSLKYPLRNWLLFYFGLTYMLAGSVLYAVKHCGVHGLCLTRYRLKVGLHSQKLKYCCKAFFLQEWAIGAKDSSTVSC